MSQRFTHLICTQLCGYGIVELRCTWLAELKPMYYLGGQHKMSSGLRLLITHKHVCLQTVHYLTSLLCFFPEGLSLLGAYEDSDEEEDTDSQPSTIRTQHNQSADILANFMAVSIKMLFFC